jgi:hypothetical protein
MTLEIQVLAWDRYKNMTGLNQLKYISIQNELIVLRHNIFISGPV